MTKKTVGLLILGVAMLAASVGAQAPDTLWTKTFGGAYNDEAWQVQPASDNGLIVIGAGMPQNFGNWDLQLIKTDVNGNAIWTKNYGGPFAEQGRAVRQTPDGGYIAVGWKRSSAIGGKEIWLLKLNASGDTLWTRTYNDYTEQEARTIELTPDGGYLMAGWAIADWESYEDVYIIRVDSLGNVIWRKNYGGENSQKAWSAKPTSDGGYIVAGWTDNHPNITGMYIIKTDSNGDTLWTRIFTTQFTFAASSILETDDHRFIVGGSLNVEWSNNFNAILLYLDDSGDIDHMRFMTFGKIYSIARTREGGLIIAGTMVDDLSSSIIVRTDIMDGESWIKNIGEALNSRISARSAFQASDGGYVFTGTTKSYPENIVLVKLANETTSINGDQIGTLPAKFTLSQNYPNPFNAQTSINYILPIASNVSVGIFDILGRKLATLYDGNQEAGNHQIIWNASEQSSGIYFYRIQVGNYAETKKMVLLK